MKALTILRIVFTSVGAFCLLAGGFWVFLTLGFMQDAKVTEGQVIELRRGGNSDDSIGYRPVVRFKDTGGQSHQFISNFSSNPPMFEPGDWVQVAYSKSNPSSAQVKEFWPLWLGPIIFGFIGLIFFSIGLGFTFIPALRKRRNDKLRQRGKPIPARVTEVTMNTSVTVNGRHPFVIHAQWFDPQTSSVRLFKSDNFWYDPEPYLAHEEVTVFVDKQNPKRYWMDTSFLPELAD